MRNSQFEIYNFTFRSNPLGRRFSHLARPTGNGMKNDQQTSHFNPAREVASFIRSKRCRGPLKRSTVAQETNPISRSFRRNQESGWRI